MDMAVFCFERRANWELRVMVFRAWYLYSMEEFLIAQKVLRTERPLLSVVFLEWSMFGFVDKQEEKWKGALGKAAKDLNSVKNSYEKQVANLEQELWELSL